ncbi:mRNA surveillance protein pelota, partial [Candidatus Micrarchaeota archaeon]
GTGKLRVTGKIKDGFPEEYVQIGSYHTIEIMPGEQLFITKQWKNYQLERLRQAQAESRRPKLAIVAMDDEKATVALVKGFGVRKVCEIESKASKRDKPKAFEQAVKKYYEQIMNKISKYKHRIIIAGPGFDKDNFKKFVKAQEPELLKRLSFESCSNPEITGVHELLRQGIISKIASEERAAREMSLMDAFISAASKQEGLVAYGRKAVKQALELGAVSKLLVNDELLRQEKEVEELVNLFEEVSGQHADVFNSQEYSGRQLAGFGGIAAFLKFRIN